MMKPSFYMGYIIFNK